MEAADLGLGWALFLIICVGLSVPPGRMDPIFLSPGFQEECWMVGKRDAQVRFGELKQSRCGGDGGPGASTAPPDGQGSGAGGWAQAPGLPEGSSCGVRRFRQQDVSQRLC